MKKAAFRKAHQNECRALAAYYRRHLLEDIMPFWDGRILDNQYGGYFNCFDRSGILYDDIKPGWFAGRSMYMYSALYNKIEKRQRWLDIASAGRSFLEEKAMDKSFRFHYMMQRDGSQIMENETIFTDHFAVKGLFEYIEASGSTRDIPLAEKIFDTLLANISNSDIVLAESADKRFMKHAVNFMNLLIGIEAGRLFPEKAKPLTEDALHKTLYVFANSAEQAPLEYVLLSGEPLYEGVGRIIDPGHTLESLWFSMHAGLECASEQIVCRASEIVDWVIDRAWDNEYGGFYQNVDVFDAVPEKPFLTNNYAGIDVAWDDKIWWVQSEALYTLALSALETGNERHFQYFLKLHDYCKTCFFDRDYGEWYSLLKRDGSMLSDKKGSRLKGPYHVPRSVMQLALLFERYSNEKES